MIIFVSVDKNSSRRTTLL